MPNNRKDEWEEGLAWLAAIAVAMAIGIFVWGFLPGQILQITKPEPWTVPALIMLLILALPGTFVLFQFSIGEMRKNRKRRRKR